MAYNSTLSGFSVVSKNKVSHFCMYLFYLFFPFFCQENVDGAGDITAHNGKTNLQVKEEEEETEEQPVAKRRRGQSKNTTKTEEMPKKEVKSEGKIDTVRFT